MFGLLFPQYSKHAAQFVVHTQHAHNGFLQLADDAGLVGLLAVAALAVRDRVRAVAHVAQRLARAAAAGRRVRGALIGFATHNQVDAGNIWKAPAIALAFVGAIIVRNYMESVGGERRPAAAIRERARHARAPTYWAADRARARCCWC